MSTFAAVVVSHANNAGLRKLLGNLRYQSRKPDETLVMISEPGDDTVRLREEFPEARFIQCENRDDWGHAKRALGLEIAEADYVGFFNDDDSYNANYVQAMLSEAERHDAEVVFCGWSTYPDPEFRLGSSTSGNFIVRSSVAREVGYPADRVYENDGHFIDALAAVADPIVKVPAVLYHHNVQ